MERVSKFLGKPVISIYDANIEGYIKNVLLDKKMNKILWLCVFDDDSQEEKLISTASIYNFAESAVMIKNSENTFWLDTIDTKDINPIGYKVYNVDGKFVGQICDVEFNNHFTVQNIYLQNDELLEKSNILNVGEKVIIKKENKNISISNFKPKSIVVSSQTENIPVTILETERQEKLTPKKVLTDGYEFLIGRKVGQNIYTENGQLIAKKNSKITAHIIDLASKNGQLKELTSYSLV